MALLSSWQRAGDVVRVIGETVVFNFHGAHIRQHITRVSSLPTHLTYNHCITQSLAVHIDRRLMFNLDRLLDAFSSFRSS